MSKLDINNEEQQPQYTSYQEVDQEQLQKDIDAIKKTIEVGQEDFEHLLKMEKW